MVGTGCRVDFKGARLYTVLPSSAAQKEPRELLPAGLSETTGAQACRGVVEAIPFLLIGHKKGRLPGAFYLALVI
jgi:hypothetical protein